MNIFEYMEREGHEQLVFCYDKVSGLKAIIAIHDTTLGPSLGGCRMWPYASEDEAIADALRLAKGMTYKNSAMGLNLGGGKAVIIADSRTDKSEELFRAFGKFVQSLGGRYITAEDMGTGTDDMTIVNMETRFVVGLPSKSGDPSPATAFGVYRGMKACAKEVWGSESLAGKTVAVQGAGNVAYHLCGHLHEEGARIIITDIYPEKVERVVRAYGATAADPGEIIGVECDIFCPAARGGVINDETIPKLKCKIVAGPANNQLQEARHGDVLREKGILYAPDFVINGGGVTNVAEEFDPAGYNKEKAYAKISKIYDKIARIIEISKRQNISTHRAADVMAEERIEKLARLKRIHLPE